MNEISISEFNLEGVPFDESGQLNSFLEPVFRLPKTTDSELDSPDQFPEQQLPEKYKLIFSGNQGVGGLFLVF